MSWRRFIFETMGTVGNVLYPTEDSALEREISDLLARYEATFSTYREDSEISAINQGRASLTSGSKLLLSGYEVAMEWYAKTGGLFNPYPTDAYLDLNGVVKAMAIESIGQLLQAKKLDSWSINIGGDVLTQGMDERGGSWEIGIVDPQDRTRLWGVVALGEDVRAIATSGISERGGHIWTRSLDASLTQASVAGRSLLEVDVLATAAIAAGSVNAANELLARFNCATFLHEDAQAYANGQGHQLLLH